MSEWKPKHNHWAIAFTVTLATFMEVLDTSIANVSLPHIAGNLSEGMDAATWVLTSYLVSNAVVLPLSGWLSTIFGRKRFYMTCVALFTLSSFACGLAPNLPILIVCRILQGAGGGGLAPSEQAILADTFPPQVARHGLRHLRHGRRAGAGIGPTLGGFITDNFSWRWIFFINVPVGIISLVLTERLVEDPPWLRRDDKQSRPRGDWIGVGLIVIGLGALQYVLDKGERDDWFGSPTIVFFSVTSATALVAMVIWEWRHPDPIIDLRMLKRRSFAVSFCMMLVLGLVLFGTTVLLPQYVQTLLGYTAQEAGMVLSPGGLVVITLLPLVGRLLGKVDPRWLIGFGFLVTALALHHMTALYLGIAFSTAVAMRCYQSVGFAFLFVPINTVSYVGVPREKNNQVSAMINLARNLGGSIGISLATTMLARRAQHHQAQLVAHTTNYDAAFRAGLAQLTARLHERGLPATTAARQALARIYGAVQAQATALAYIDTLQLLAIVAMVMIPLTLLLQKPKPGAPIAAH